MSGLMRLAILISLMGVVFGCGTDPVPPADLKPGLQISPIAGIVYEKVPDSNYYTVEIKCQAYLNFTTQEVSTVESQCDESLYEGEAVVLLTRSQIQEIFDYWRRYN